MKILLEIEALEPVAVLSPAAPGAFLITRSAILDRSVLVRLAVRGTADAGSDYQAILGYVNLDPFQTTAIVPVTPLAGASLDRGRESVVTEIVPDAAYRVGARDKARVVLIDEWQDLAGWKQTHFPAYEGSLEDFASEDSGETGISHLLRYAYGMDPVHPQRERLPRAYLLDGRLTVDLYKNPAATDLVYRVGVSGDLDGWDHSASAVREAALLDEEDPGATRFQSTESIDALEKLFMLIDVSKKP